MPYRLTAPAPGWTATTDVVVVGSGVAGLTVALNVRRAGLRATVVTKAMLDDGSTRWAQGGIAAALGEGDTPEQHLDDTLVASAACATRTRCAPSSPRARTPCAAHRRRRRLRPGRGRHDPAHPRGRPPPPPDRARRRRRHRRGDIPRPGRRRPQRPRHRADRARARPRPAHRRRRARGRLTLHVMGEGQRDGVGAIRARAVVLATGGMGQVFSATTNPAVSTGDGVALALRAGAEVADLEFVQFHPTVLWLGADAEGQQPLVSEAVRGEGAHLVDASGERFMLGQHELAELAPRDIVAKAITRQMQLRGTDRMYLDGRHFGAEMWEHRFPTILASCRAHGIDPVTDLIPVAPAAHYASGGVRTDPASRTTVPGLYACGEVACTGVHGANRLASNSLLEGLVFAERIAADLAARHAAGDLPERAVDVAAALEASTVPLLAPEARAEIQRLMSRGAGVLRSAGSMAATAEGLTVLAREASAYLDEGKPADPRVETWEAANLHLVATALVAAAARREETRGCHWREDFPDRDDARWQHHLVTTLDADGHPSVRA
ncbi:FAD-binding protein [Kitasatospora arboriphila]